MMERINQELKRRTLVVRIFPNAASCRRLIRALAVEIHEGWIEATRYLNMEVLKEQLKEQLHQPPDGWPREHQVRAKTWKNWKSWKSWNDGRAAP